jgi:hypothetical protein
VFSGKRQTYKEVAYPDFGDLNSGEMEPLTTHDFWGLILLCFSLVSGVIAKWILFNGSALADRNLLR